MGNNQFIDLKMNILISGSYSAFQEGFNGAGIYLATGLIPSSVFLRPIYFGSTNNLKGRICNAHIPHLLNNDHDNKPLQHYFNNHGKDNLIWYLVETTNPENCLLREQFYLDSERPFVDEMRGFNIAHDALAPMLGRKHTSEARLKISEASKRQKGKKMKRFNLLIY